MANRNLVTIAVLAKELGLGKATVSLALRDDPRIRKQTREGCSVMPIKGDMRPIRWWPM